MIGVSQLLLILIICFLLFGANKIPTIMSDLAKGIKIFKKVMNEDEESRKSEQGNHGKKTGSTVGRKKVSSKSGSKQRITELKNGIEKF